jgi:thioredoxin reductase
MFIENLIIGAGPSGIQLGYFMSKYNINYLIVEQNKNCGSFFEKYPHSKELISLNKIYTGQNDPDFNLRHDWNSLLNDEDFLFKNYSKELYPNSDDLKKYLNAFSEKFNINIIFNQKISKIEKNNKLFYLFEGDQIKYTCVKLIIATGLSKKVMPKFLNDNDDRIIHYSDFPNNYFMDLNNLNEFNNKHVVFIGAGNSAFELANLLLNNCATITIISKNKLFENSNMITKYSGSLRMKYLKVLDSFYLKSQVAILENNINPYEQISSINIINDNLVFYISNTQTTTQNTRILQVPGKIFKVICCTGTKFDDSIFNFEIEKTVNDKFPKIDHKYQSSNIENLYFIGNLMHSKDYKISSGGFIHGFRYLIKLFTHINYNLPFKCKIFEFNGSLDIYEQLAKYILYRINTSSDLYQMHSVLCDNFYYNSYEKKIYYYENVTKELIQYEKIHNGKQHVCVGLQSVLEKNKKYDVRDVHMFERFNQSYLHPYFDILNNHGRNVKTLPEELFINFSEDRFLHEVKDILKTCPLIF